MDRCKNEKTKQKTKRTHLYSISDIWDDVIPGIVVNVKSCIFAVLGTMEMSAMKCSWFVQSDPSTVQQTEQIPRFICLACAHKLLSFKTVTFQCFAGFLVSRQAENMCGLCISLYSKPPPFAGGKSILRSWEHYKYAHIITHGSLKTEEVTGGHINTEVILNYRPNPQQAWLPITPPADTVYPSSVIKSQC